MYMYIFFLIFFFGGGGSKFYSGAPTLSEKNTFIEYHKAFYETASTADKFYRW